MEMGRPRRTRHPIRHHLGGAANPAPNAHSQQPRAASQPIPLRQIDGAAALAPSLPLTIEPHQRVRLLFDQRVLTTAYPEVVLSGGEAARITLTYLESLYEPDSSSKGHRDSIANKLAFGAQDVFVADGGSNRTFRPLWWRAYRYVVLQIETQAESLRLEAMQGRYTAYPFQTQYRFDAPEDPQLVDILRVGERTQRLCANETFMDCPYYEQLQYAGDTRIQQLVSLYAFGDHRLMRQAIDQIDQSRLPSGLTMSRYPTRVPQYIPGFSLLWVASVHDYWRYVPDVAFVQAKLPGVRAVLDWHLSRTYPDGSLPFLPWWNFYDWAWERGIPPMDAEGHAAIKDLLWLYALQLAVEMEQTVGDAYHAQRYAEVAQRLKTSIRQRYWEPKLGLIRDLPDSALYSQHANSFAVLTGVVTAQEAPLVMQRVLEDSSLLGCNLGFFFYLTSALRMAGLGDRYLETLAGWREQLALGLSTWVEEPNFLTSRSDCHAWGCVPNIELFRTVLGIESGAPGFAEVQIMPHLGTLTEASGEMPHPNGTIRVSLRRVGANGLVAEISLPEGVPGVLHWQGVSRSLTPGTQRLQMNP